RWRNAPSPDTSATSRPGSTGSGAALAEGAGRGPVVGATGGGDGADEHATARPAAPTAAARSSAARSGVARRRVGPMRASVRFTGRRPDLWTTSTRNPFLEHAFEYSSGYGVEQS